MSAAVGFTPYRVALPEGTAAPLVFDSPHSGFVFPPDFHPAAPLGALQTTWDAYVEELFGDAPQCGAALLSATFPRAYIDVNRAPDDIDPDLLSTAWPLPLTATDYSRRGMGLIRRLALPGVPMYSERLTVEAVQRRLTEYYIPYRRALELLLGDIQKRHGCVIHINCHSMKSQGNEMNVDAGARRPDFVVSDRNGRSAAPAVTAWVARFFADCGYRVQTNDPYQGGNLVATFGRPAARSHSVQVEINRALYMNEEQFTRAEGFERVRKTLKKFATALSAAVLAGEFAAKMENIR